MDRQTMLSMFTSAMRHRQQYGAGKWGAETWQKLSQGDLIDNLERLYDQLQNSIDPACWENAAISTTLVDISNYCAFLWAHLQGLPGRDISTAGRPVSPSLRDIQQQIAAWSAKNNLGGSPEMMFLGVTEEMGEFAHALLKHRQGIRGYDDPAKFSAEARDALGDCLIYLTQLADVLGWDLQEIVEKTAAHVLKRNWIANPVDADQVAAATPAFDDIPAEGQ